MAKKTNRTHILLVESETDRGFMEQVCKKANLETYPKFETAEEYETPEKIKIGKPKDFDKSAWNSKQGVLNLLRDFLPDLIDRTIQKLAIIIDADYDTTNGLGFQGVLNQIETKAKEFDFEIAEQSNVGIIFKHQDNESIEFGVWIMPNNQHNGELEDFVKSCIQTEQPEQCLFLHAQKTLKILPQIKFAATDIAKAEIATWLAWQEKPGHGLYYSLYANLLNEDYPDFKNIVQWLQRVFAQ